MQSNTEQNILEETGADAWAQFIGRLTIVGLLPPGRPLTIADGGKRCIIIQEDFLPWY